MCDCICWIWGMRSFSQDASEGFEEGGERYDAGLVVKEGEDRAEDSGGVEDARVFVGGRLDLGYSFGICNGLLGVGATSVGLTVGVN